MNATEMKFSFWWIFLVVVLVSVCLVNRVECVDLGIKKAQLFEIAHAYVEHCIVSEEDIPTDKHTHHLVCAARWNLLISLESEPTSSISQMIKGPVPFAETLNYEAAALLLLMQATYFDGNYVEGEKMELYRKALAHHRLLSPKEIIAANKDKENIVYGTFAIILEVVIKCDRFKDVREEFIREVQKDFNADHKYTETALHVWRTFEKATFLENQFYVEKFRTYIKSQTQTNTKDSMPKQTQRFNAIRGIIKLRKTDQSPSIKNEPPTEPTLQLTDIVLYWLGDIPKAKSEQTRPQFVDSNKLYDQIKFRMRYWEQVQLTENQARAIIQSLLLVTELFGENPIKIAEWRSDQARRLYACIQILVALMRRKFPEGDAHRISLELLIFIAQLFKGAEYEFRKIDYKDYRNYRKTLKDNLDEMIGTGLATSPGGPQVETIEPSTHVQPELSIILQLLRSRQIMEYPRDIILGGAETYLKKRTNTNR